MHELDIKGAVDARPELDDQGEFTPQIDASRLAQRIQTAVRRSTCGGIRQLDVQVEGELVVLHGRCGTYYCKQLAQHAAMNLIESLMLDLAVSNEISVW